MALGDFGVADAAGAATHDPGVRLGDAGAAEETFPAVVGPGGGTGGAALGDEEAVGKRAEVDAGAVGEAGPIAGGEDVARRVREVVAPMTFHAGGEETAGGLVGAGGDDVEGLAEVVADRLEVPGGFVGARFDPEDGGGGGSELEEVDALFVGELVPDVGKDEERAFGVVRCERAGFDLRMEATGLLDGEIDRERGRIVEPGPAQGGERGQDAVGRDAAAATPVDERIGARRRSPAEGRKFGEDRVPLPSCLLYTSPSPRDRQKSRMPSSA